MRTISDEDLILYHYRDGLTPDRLREIEQAIGTSPALALRLDALRRLLDAVAADAPPEPDEQFADRQWHRLQPRLKATAETTPLHSAGPWTRARHGMGRAAAAWRYGLAGLGVAGLALFLWTSSTREALTPKPEIATAARSPTPDRVLATYVASHLRNVEAALFGAIHSGGSAFARIDHASARSLADDNRLYATAAARRGHEALSRFLETLGPVLAELANGRPGSLPQTDQALRNYLSESDLLFQVRTVEKRLQLSRDLELRGKETAI